MFPARSLTCFLAAALAALGVPAQPAAAADLLVTSSGSDKVLRFDATSGAFGSVFASLIEAVGIASDGTGNVYVSSVDGSITRYDESGNLLDSIVVPGGSSVGPIAVGSDGRVYGCVFAGDRVVRVDFSVALPQVVDFVASGSGGLDGPTGLAFGGPDGDLYVSSRITGRVLRYDGATGAFVGIFSEPGGNGPQGLTFGPNGDLFVANSATHTVRRYDADSGSDLGTFATAIGTGSDGMTPVFGPDGDLYLSLPLFSDQIEQFDGTSGASLGVFIASGTGGLQFPRQMVFVPEPGAGSSALAAALALGAARRLRGRAPGV